MFRLSGTLSRKAYFIALVKLVLLLIVGSFALLAGLNYVDGSATNASTTTQVTSVVLFFAFLLFLLAILYSLVALSLRRGRDFGEPVVGALIALFIPVGMLFIGLIPTRKQ